MSLAALMTGPRSTRFALSRQTLTEAADGSSAKTWTKRGTVRGFVDGMTAEASTRVFGADVVAALVLLVPLDADVRAKDGLTALAGPFAGTRFKIEGRHVASGRRRSAHAQLALVETEDAFDAE